MESRFRSIFGRLLSLVLVTICADLAIAQQASSGPPQLPSPATKPVIGAMSPDEINWKLAEMGAISPEQAAKNQNKIKTSNTYKQAFDIGSLLGIGKTPIWKYTQHQFGFIPLLSTVAPGTSQLSVTQVSSVTPDSTLKSGSITVTLDRLRVAGYPGGGRHNILFTYTTQNQATSGTEDAKFSQNYEVLEGQGAGIAGYPIFVGLHLPANGLGLQCHTTNVSNDDDEKVLAFLKGSTFQGGLKLLDSINPVIPVVSGFATGLLTDIESRNQNVGVQDFYLGLDFSSTPGGARLAQGSYIAVQAPDDGWSWDNWVFDIGKGQVVGEADGKPIPYHCCPVKSRRESVGWRFR